MTPYLAALNDYITEAFNPKPISCRINGKLYLIERVTGGWAWRNEDGDMQEEPPFAEAWQAQQDAISDGRAK